jgi:hypothetical protein
MNIVIQPSAQSSILSVSEYIEDLNTIGSGERWIQKLLTFCKKYALPNIQYSLCNDAALAKQKLSCIVFNNWIIAFTIEEDTFIIHHVIYGRLLK